MTSTIDQAWDDLKSSETARTRAYESRVSRILNGSGSKQQVKSRSVRGNPSGIQREHRTEGLSFADLESKVLGSPASGVDQVGGAGPRQPLGEETDGSIAFEGITVLVDRRTEEAAKPYERSLTGAFINRTFVRNASGE